MWKWILLIALTLGGASVIAGGGQDATGTWKAIVQGRNGPQESTFVLKVEGGKVTGSLNGMRGSRPISDGKIEGDRISFSINTDFGVIRYSGVVKGDEMKMTLTAGEGQFTLDFEAHRVPAVRFAYVP